MPGGAVASKWTAVSAKSVVTRLVKGNKGDHLPLLRAKRVCLNLMTAAVLCIALGSPRAIAAQGITTASIRGSVHAGNGSLIADANVLVTNLSTGYATDARARNGRFFIQGLPLGGPYRVTVTSVGYAPQVLGGVSLSLGETRDLDFSLTKLASQLDTVRVSARKSTLEALGHGVGTLISDSALSRLPTLNRDMYDFVRLVPQVGTRFGLSGGGASFRLNSYMIDGVSDRQLQGNNVMGGGSTGGKSISIEALKEYQVLLSPYDARYGGFAGMLVNAVTKSGTNELHGSAYGYVRNEQLARANSFVGSSPYRREQFGFSVGGPIVRDRLHFFVTPEFQHSMAPALGPYVGQSANASSPLPASPADIERFASLLGGKGFQAGDGGRVTSLNPAMTLFARLDLSLPEWKSRVELRDNYSAVEVTRFARPEGNPVFPLSSNAWTLRTAKHAPAIQVFTHAPRFYNEFVLSYMDRPLLTKQQSSLPFVQTTVGPATLVAGPPTAAGGSGSSQILTELGDHFSFQPGSRHTVGLGLHAEIFQYHAKGVRGSLGQWRFASLDALANDDAFTYSISKDFGSANASVRGVKPGAYASDEWRINDALTLSLGLRADALKLSTRPDYNPAVDSIFGRNTSDYPRTRVQWSPRFGFSWHPSGNHETRISGGVGIFNGPPPMGWLVGPVRSNGAGIRTLACNGIVGSGKVPKFVADPAKQPLVCPDGRGFSDGPVALVDRNLKMAESFRTSLTIQQQLPGRVNGSIDALYSRVRSDYMFVNADLAGPQGTDSHGRILYGSIDLAGRAHPVRISKGRFPEVIDLRNHSLGHSWSVTGQIDRSFFDRYELRAAYTRSRVRDLQSIINPSAVLPFEIWASARPFSGRQDEMKTGISSYDVPNRFLLAATYAAPWKRWKTDISLYYIGESGSPFTFGDSAAALGDLNADSTSADDPIYVPRDAHNPSEIVFSGADAQAQADAFEQFIDRTPCLQRQRGRIVARNSCRGAWVNTSNASIRQSLQSIGGHGVSIQVEVFNVLNLLNSQWGQWREPRAVILQQVGQTTGASPQPTFYFNPATASATTRNLESGYQLQLSLRYTF